MTRALNELIITACLLLAATMMRPTLLGEVATPVALFITVFSLVYMVLAKNTRMDRELFERNCLIATAVVVFWSFLAIHSLLLGGNEVEFLLKGIITIVITMAVFSVALSTWPIQRMFFRGLVILMVATVLSYIVTTVLSLVIPLDHLLLTQIETQYGERSGQIYFPFTAAYGHVQIADVQLLRFPGLFREAGIFQAFIVWAYFSLSLMKLDKWWIRIVLLAGLVVSFSTAGIATFMATAVLWLVLVEERFGMGSNLAKTISVFGLLFVGAALVVYAPVVGLLDKLQYAEVSVSDRLDAITIGLTRFSDGPLGVGLYNSNIQNIGINLLSALYMIGIGGIILLLMLAIVALLTVPFGRQRRKQLVLIFPFFVTALFSQPFIEAPLVYAMLFQWPDIEGGGEIRMPAAEVWT